MKRKWIVILSILLLATTLACSVFSNDATPEPTATTAPQDTDDAPPSQSSNNDDDAPPPTPTTAADITDVGAASIELDADALEGLDSYRLTMNWELTDDTGKTENFTIEQEATRDPSAQRFVMADSEGQGVEFIQIEDTQWVRFGDEWVQTSSEDGMTEGFDDFAIDPDNMFGDLDDGEYEDLGMETVNGMQTRHLRVEEQTWTTLGALDDADIETGVADIWIVEENDLPQFVARMELEMQATIEGESGTIKLSWEVYDVNEPITIEAPAEAAEMGLPGDIPLCPNSSELTAMGQMSMFTCEGEAADVNEFYTEELTALGWEKTTGAEIEGMYTSSWTKDDETIQLTIMTEDDTTNVMIVSQ